MNQEQRDRGQRSPRLLLNLGQEKRDKSAPNLTPQSLKSGVDGETNEVSSRMKPQPFDEYCAVHLDGR